MIGGPVDSGLSEMAMLWVLNLSDGSHTLLDIAERSGMRFDAIKRACEALQEHGLLRECPELRNLQLVEPSERTKS
jgi:aminopeptidase-like protein